MNEIQTKMYATDIKFNISVQGSGPLLVLIMGMGSSGRAWQLYQVPAFVEAGYTVVTFDNRGSGISEHVTKPFTIEDMVNDVIGIIKLFNQPARVLGTSLGAKLTQELMLVAPELVVCGVLAAAHSHLMPFQLIVSAAEAEVQELLLKNHRKFLAAQTAVRNFSPKTLLNKTKINDWLDILEFSLHEPTSGFRLQAQLDRTTNKLAEYKKITVPALAIAYADDRVIFPQQVQEVAESIPGCEFIQISDTGHYGYLEKPDEFNKIVIDYLERYK